MIIFVITFPKKKKAIEQKIFDPYFVKKYKNNFKIVYNNKLLPLQTKLYIGKKLKKKIKIQLICFLNNFLLNDLIRGCQNFSEIHPSEKFKNNIKNFYRTKIFFINSSIILYYIFEEKTKIFGKNFVKNNIGKCIFL